ncbi:MAG: hypothetical protein JSV12_03565 [Candidatus Bathyarchaeota archaeon]|nr:MAG: hypothetical protein JSV12_03565 [Candidatus Bathyarchaeota archaeon]
MKGKDRFNELLLKVIDEELKQMFGEAAALIIYAHLEDNYSLERTEIPEKLDVFIMGLEEFLSSGAQVIQKIILKKVYLTFGCKCETKQGYGFIDYLTELKKNT